MTTVEGDFSVDFYAIVRNFVQPDRIGDLTRHVVERLKAGTTSSDSTVRWAPAMAADPECEQLLADLVPAVSELTKLDLEATYSYVRYYRNGDQLPRHRDRPACEVSVSLNVASRPPAPWPLYLEGPSGITSVLLARGDAVVYRGCDCWHWREPFAGEGAIQAFLHYVDRKGAHAAERFDGRGRLGTLPHGSVPVHAGARVIVSGKTASLTGADGTVLALDETELLVWRSLDAGTIVPDVVVQVQRMRGFPRSTAQLFVRRVLETLRDGGFVVL
jgi:hypothetical protein